MEVVNTTTGKKEDGKCSELCKLEMFRRFSEIFGKVPSITPPMDIQKMTYAEVKAAAKDYQKAEAIFVKGLQSADLGSYAGKPAEQDQFTL